MDFCGLNIVGNICDTVRTELNDMKHKEEQRSSCFYVDTLYSYTSFKFKGVHIVHSRGVLMLFRDFISFRRPRDISSSRTRYFHLNQVVFGSKSGADSSAAALISFNISVVL